MLWVFLRDSGFVQQTAARDMRPMSQDVSGAEKGDQRNYANNENTVYLVMGSGGAGPLLGK